MKRFAIYFSDVYNPEDNGAYVKMYPHTNTRTGEINWLFKPVNTYAEASKWQTESQANRAIRGIPAFNGRGGGDSWTAIVVTE